jgi:hypothetical protein
MPATLTFAGIDQRVDALFGPDGLKIVGVPKQNHPMTGPAITDAFDKAVSEGAFDWSFRLSFRTPDFRTASMGWLRAGYLVAFATLGYLYALREELEIVRDQIREPDAEILARYCVMTGDGPTGGRIMFVRDPGELASVIVFSNNCAVFLPSDWSRGTYVRLGEVEQWPPGTKELCGSSAPRPTKPVYPLDRIALDRLACDAQGDRP